MVEFERGARAMAMNMCPLCVPFGIHSSLFASLFASLLTLLKNCVLFSFVSEQSEGWSNVIYAMNQGLNSE